MSLKVRGSWEQEKGCKRYRGTTRAVKGLAEYTILGTDGKHIFADVDRPNHSEVFELLKRPSP